MKTDRRALIATLPAALIAAPALIGRASPVQAKAPMAEVQAPAFYRLKLGAMQVTALHDGQSTFPLPPGFVRNASTEEVKAALGESFLPTDTLTISFTTFLVQTGEKRVLVDTGFADNGSPTNGKTRSQLRAAGLSPEDIDVVILTHFHGDHLQGLRAKDGSLIYPNAEIFVPEAEWAFWMDDAKMASANERLKANFAGVRRVFVPGMGRITQYRPGREIVTGIMALDASGHTPGHSIVALSSEGRTMLLVADVTNMPALFVRRPDWQVMFDMDAERAEATRRRVLDMAATDRLLLGFYHAPFPALGHVLKDGPGFRFVPVQWSSVL